MSSTEINLQYPFKDSTGREVTNISLRRATVGDVEQATKINGDFAQTIKMVEMLAEMAPVDVRKIDPVDFAELSKAVADFLP